MRSVTRRGAPAALAALAAAGCGSSAPSGPLAHAASTAAAPSCLPARLDQSAKLPGVAVEVTPGPGTTTADPATQISFLGVPASKIASVAVTGAHSGTHSVKISSGGGFFGVPPPTTAFYGRAWVYLDGTPGSGHWAFIEGVSSGAQGAATQVRWGGNVGTYDANVQTSGPEYEIQARADGGAIAPPASQWMCVEFYYGQDALQLWQDGTQILNITSTTVWQGGAAPSLPAYAMVRLGYAAFGASSIDVWFDDVSIDPRRIGCN